MINLILDAIIITIESPDVYELTLEKYKDKVNQKSEKDMLNIFSEDLQDTAAKDDEELEEDEDYYDDDGFVVSDSEDPYEPYEPVNKKQKTGGEMINWEELRKYDRPGGEMIFRPWEKNLKNMTLEKLRRRIQQREQGGEMINRPWERWERYWNNERLKKQGSPLVLD